MEENTGLYTYIISRTNRTQSSASIIDLVAQFSTHLVAAPVLRQVFVRWRHARELRQFARHVFAPFQDWKAEPQTGPKNFVVHVGVAVDLHFCRERQTGLLVLFVGRSAVPLRCKQKK